MKGMAFRFSATPTIHFGAGQRALIPDLAAGFGRRIALVTGGRSFDDSPLCQELLDQLEARFDVVRRIRVQGEPSPEQVDEAVQALRNDAIQCVVAIGGGSPVDAAKAIAGLLPSGDSVMEYLEGVGRGKAHDGRTVPFIAAPTTAGTGGETSKNAVISRIGPDGFKKSFRHECLVARHVVLDPELTASCPPRVTAACGMDAFTQLLESLVSRNASPMTDALAFSGLERAIRALPKAVLDGLDMRARADMLYASSISGLTLANAGLGSVHALASSIGAFFPMPHGEVCAALLPAACRLNIEWLEQHEPNAEALHKYARVGRLFARSDTLTDAEARRALVAGLERWMREFGLPGLAQYGVKAPDASRIVNGAGRSNLERNPARLSEAELQQLVLDSL